MSTGWNPYKPDDFKYNSLIAAVKRNDPSVFSDANFQQKIQELLAGPHPDHAIISFLSGGRGEIKFLDYLLHKDSSLFFEAFLKFIWDLNITPESKWKFFCGRENESSFFARAIKRNRFHMILPFFSDAFTAAHPEFRLIFSDEKRKRYIDAGILNPNCNADEILMVADTFELVDYFGNEKKARYQASKRHKAGDTLNALLRVSCPALVMGDLVVDLVGVAFGALSPLALIAIFIGATILLGSLFLYGHNYFYSRKNRKIDIESKVIAKKSDLLMVECEGLERDRLEHEENPSNRLAMDIAARTGFLSQLVSKNFFDPLKNLYFRAAQSYKGHDFSLTHNQFNMRHISDLRRSALAFVAEILCPAGAVSGMILLGLATFFPLVPVWVTTAVSTGSLIFFSGVFSYFAKKSIYDVTKVKLQKSLVDFRIKSSRLKQQQFRVGKLLNRSSVRDYHDPYAPFILQNPLPSRMPSESLEPCRNTFLRLLKRPYTEEEGLQYFRNHTEDSRFDLSEILTAPDILSTLASQNKNARILIAVLYYCRSILPFDEFHKLLFPESGRSLLHIAVEANAPSVVEALLLQYDESDGIFSTFPDKDQIKFFHQQDETGKSALVHAIDKHRTLIVPQFFSSSQYSRVTRLVGSFPMNERSSILEASLQSDLCPDKDVMRCVRSPLQMSLFIKKLRISKKRAQRRNIISSALGVFCPDAVFAAAFSVLLYSFNLSFPIICAVVSVSFLSIFGLIYYGRYTSGMKVNGSLSKDILLYRKMRELLSLGNRKRESLLNTCIASPEKTDLISNFHSSSFKHGKLIDVAPSFSSSKNFDLTGKRSHAFYSDKGEAALMSAGELLCPVSAIIGGVGIALSLSGLAALTWLSFVIGAGFTVLMLPVVIAKVYKPALKRTKKMNAAARTAFSLYQKECVQAKTLMSRMSFLPVMNRSRSNSAVSESGSVGSVNSHDSVGSLSGHSFLHSLPQVSRPEAASTRHVQACWS
jgi:hypothetical protein